MTGQDATPDHSAAASLLGYQYQVDWALLELLQQGRTRPDQAMTLELHDDVAWDEAGTVRDRIQVKHHLNRQGGLGNASDDLWRTLNAWMDTAKPFDPTGSLLVLVTTTAASPGSAAFFLRSDLAERDEGQARAILEETAAQSTNQATADARQKFLALDPSIREAFVARIVVKDGQPTITDIDARVRSEAWLSLPADAAHHDTFMAMVWRWWSTVAMDLLTGRRDVVETSEARQQLALFRDMFTAESLPTLVELEDVDVESAVDLHSDKTFAHQMRWVRAGSETLRAAIVDYHRAVTQTTDWLDRDLIGLSELTKFENNLVDEWRRARADMMEDLPEDADEQAVARAGLELFRMLRDSTAVHVRSRYTDAFFGRGKRHELADSGSIGWHPHFEDMLRALLEGSSDSEASTEQLA